MLCSWLRAWWLGYIYWTSCTRHFNFKRRSNNIAQPKSRVNNTGCKVIMFSKKRIPLCCWLQGCDMSPRNQLPYQLKSFGAFLIKMPMVISFVKQKKCYTSTSCRPEHGRKQNRASREIQSKFLCLDWIAPSGKGGLQMGWEGRILRVGVQREANKNKYIYLESTGLGSNGRTPIGGGAP